MKANISWTGKNRRGERERETKTETETGKSRCASKVKKVNKEGKLRFFKLVMKEITRMMVGERKGRRGGEANQGV